MYLPALRFCNLLIISVFVFCLGGISPKRRWNCLITKQMQKRGAGDSPAGAGGWREIPDQVGDDGEAEPA